MQRFEWTDYIKEKDEKENFLDRSTDCGGIKLLNWNQENARMYVGMLFFCNLYIPGCTTMMMVMMK